MLGGTTRITGNIVTRQVSFILKPDDNNAEYRCNASNLATIEPLITSVRLQVNCELHLDSPALCLLHKLLCVKGILQSVRGLPY